MAPTARRVMARAGFHLMWPLPVSGMLKVVRALLGCKCFDELADQLHQRCHGTSGALAQRRFQTSEEVPFSIGLKSGESGRQITHSGHDRFDRLANAVDLCGRAQVYP